MSDDRFKLEINPGPNIEEYCIVDNEQDVLTIYNNLGRIYCTSAPALCELLNSLDKKNKKLINYLIQEKKEPIEKINNILKE